MNYLRMYRLALELSEEDGLNGLPIDQSCDKAWTFEDQKRLIADLPVCGKKQPCDENDENSENICDGINALEMYNAGTNSGGDLVVPADSKLAEGLDHQKDFEPVYVYYIPPDKNSFIFSKRGAASINGQ